MALIPGAGDDLEIAPFCPCGLGHIINAGGVVHGNGNGLGIGEAAFFQEFGVGCVAIVNRKSGAAFAGNKGASASMAIVGNFVFVQHGANEMAHATEASHDMRCCPSSGGFKRFRELPCSFLVRLMSCLPRIERSGMAPW